MIDCRVPDPSQVGPRRIDVSPATDWLTGGFPVMKTISFNWTVVEGPHGAWYVIASHEGHLKDVAEALRDRGVEPGQLAGRFDNVGSANGVGISGHLRSWRDRADLMADPAAVEEFEATMGLMAQFAAGVERCRWKMARPGPNRMRLDVHLKLTPPISASLSAP